MARILILIGAHLCTAPRPQKEAQALRDAGHDVAVRGVWFDPVLIERDRELARQLGIAFEPVLDFAPTSLGGRVQNLRVRMAKKLAAKAFQNSKAFSPELFGYGANALLACARRYDADLTIVHSEASLWVGTQLLDEGHAVGVDFEDWFSEDLTPQARESRPNDELKAWEKRLAKSCSYCLATSDAMAKAIGEAYEAPTATTVYNVFPIAERDAIDGESRDRQDKTLPSLHWYSQTIGPGRGLETLFRAIPLINTPLEVHLRGTLYSYDESWFREIVPVEWKERVFVHPTVPNAELLSRIAEHDIGLALETDQIPSRDLTVTNKLFQYMQAGIAVIATSTSGQREIFASAPRIGALVANGNAGELASAIEHLVSDPARLAAAKTASLEAAREMYCWERQAGTVVERAEEALAAART